MFLNPSHRFAAVLTLPVMLALSACSFSSGSGSPSLRSSTAADLDSQTASQSFMPIWKLLNQQEKQQFVAGYLQGWRDAALVTDVAIRYVGDNPGEAVAGLERIRSLYDSSTLKPALVAKHIDEFYQHPENHSAAFSAAISAAKHQANASSTF